MDQRKESQQSCSQQTSYFIDVAQYEEQPRKTPAVARFGEINASGEEQDGPLTKSGNEYSDDRYVASGRLPNLVQSYD